MSFNPFDIRLVIERIRAQVPELNSVEGVAEYSAITSLKDYPAPCVYVLLAQEKNDGTPPKVAGAAQRALVTFGVVVVVQNYGDQRKGEAAANELTPLVGNIREALIGWNPTDDGRACYWLQGDVADFDQTNLLWIDIFHTQHFIK